MPFSFITSNSKITLLYLCCLNLLKIFLTHKTFINILPENLLHALYSARREERYPMQKFKILIMQMRSLNRMLPLI